MEDYILHGLNAEQRAVVTDWEHHILLNAPAGTGKTNVLARRVAAIIESGRANGGQILCLTFTNRACKELKSRIFSAVHEKGLDVIVKTIHSFCYSMIKEESKISTDLFSDFLVYDDEDCKNIIAGLPVFTGTASQGSRLQNIQNFIEAAKKYVFLKNCSSGDVQADFLKGTEALIRDDGRLRAFCTNYAGRTDAELEQWLATNGILLMEQYTAALAANHALDFEDLIVRASLLLQQDDVCRRWQNRFAYIAIDEMQDTSDIEYNLISRLFPGRIILLCGDYFQTIYEWRGSHPDAILRRFVEDYAPIRITFTINYRATETLLQASSACRASLFGPAVAAFYPVPATAAAHEQGAPIVTAEASHFMDEARWIFRQIAALPPQDRTRACIMTRTNRCNKIIWNGVRSHNEGLPPERRLPFTMIDQFQLFKRQECKDVVAFLRLAMNKHDALSLKRILLRFARRIGQRIIDTIESPSYRRLGISLCDFIDADALAWGDPFGRLLTELENDNVVVFDVESTGTDTTKDDIIQIAAIRLNKDCQVIETFNTYVRSSRSVGDSYYIHHISDDLLAKEGKEPAEALAEFLRFARGAVIVGHNVTYDLRILRSELRRLAIAAPDEVPYYDTLDIFRRFYPSLPNHKLEFLSSRFTPDTQSSHDAFDDITATAAILQYALDRHIRPNTALRQSCLAMYAALFTPISERIHKLQQQSYRERPCSLIADVMLYCGVKEYYEEPQNHFGQDAHIDRMENLRKLYRLAKETDTPSQDPRDALTEFLQLTALSNSELDSLLEKKPQIPIITVHQAKGLEFDYVFLACLQDGVFPLSRSANNSRELDEEKRLFYVAMTRARKRLFLSWHRQEGQHLCRPSRFIAAIPSKYLLQESGQAEQQAENAGAKKDFDNAHLAAHSNKSRQQNT